MQRNKGNKDRMTMLPELLKLELPEHLKKIQNDTRKILQRVMAPFNIEMH